MRTELPRQTAPHRTTRATPFGEADTRCPCSWVARRRRRGESVEVGGRRGVVCGERVSGRARRRRDWRRWRRHCPARLVLLPPPLDILRVNYEGL